MNGFQESTLTWKTYRKRRQELSLMAALFMLPWLFFIFTPSVAAKSSPDISSTALQMHKIYRNVPPHDTRLYDVLNVPANATAAQITKNYRRLSRRYHPDKVQDQSKMLRSIQQAYEILKEDSTRLTYHRYGLTNPNLAVALLLGPQHHQYINSNNHLLEETHTELLQLMVYENVFDGMEYTDFNPEGGYEGPCPSRLSKDALRQRRINFIAARLVERLRPLVEPDSPVTPSHVAHQLAYECDRWKRLPLGAQVLRCVGRAYRHAGEDFLKSQQKDLSLPFRQQWRQAKAYWTAILATGRATLTEKALTHQEKQRRRREELHRKRQTCKEIDYYSELGEVNVSMEDAKDIEFRLFSNEDNSEDLGAFLDQETGGGDVDNAYGLEEMKHLKHIEAKQTLLTSLQIEALWKVTKIDLDQTIRDACQLILSGKYFFFPSQQNSYAPRTPSSFVVHDSNDYTPPPPPPPPIGRYGWVSSQGQTVLGSEALQRTAKALVFLGDVMVERSKVQTSWRA